MQLPFSRPDFLEVFAAYNSALWPAVVALWILTAFALILFFRGRSASGTLNALLVFHWAWAALAYHAVYFTRINPAAKIFAALFLLQAGLFFWYGVSTRRLTFSWQRSPRDFLALALILYALAYPFLSILFGEEYPRTPTFGVPCPTTILTAGLLLTAETPAPLWLMAIPFIWSVVGGSAAFVLGMRADLMLFLAGGLITIDAVAPGALAGRRRV